MSPKGEMSLYESWAQNPSQTSTGTVRTRRPMTDRVQELEQEVHRLGLIVAEKDGNIAGLIQSLKEARAK